MLDIFNGNIFYNRYSILILNLNWKNDIVLYGFECLYIIFIFVFFLYLVKVYFINIYIYKIDFFLF